MPMPIDEILEEFKSLTQCCACKALPSPIKRQKERYLCDRKSHVLCFDCRKALCPCTSTVSKEPFNGFNNLLNQLGFYCAHHQSGCEEMLKEDTFENHVEKCIFRQVNCPFVDCEDSKIILNGLQKHMKKHEIPLDTFSFDFREEEIPLDIELEFFGWKIPNQKVLPKTFNPLSMLFLQCRTHFYLECRRKTKSSRKLLLWCYVVSRYKVIRELAL